jgi:hypothetical protein
MHLLHRKPFVRKSKSKSIGGLNRLMNRPVKKQSFHNHLKKCAETEHPFLV